MTANEIAAMLFPITALAAVGIAALVAVKVWGRKSKVVATGPVGPPSSILRETIRLKAVYDRLGQADRLIQEAQRELERIP